MGFDVPQGWEVRRLGEVINLKRGYDLPKSKRRTGGIPVVSSSGVSGFHDEAKASAPGVVTGRYGTIGEVFLIEEDFWPLNTALYVEDFKGNHPEYIAALLKTINWRAHDGKSGVPGINRNDVHQDRVVVPPSGEQEDIASVLSAFDDKIKSNRTLACTGDDTINAWFQHVSLGASSRRVPLADIALEVKTRIQPTENPADAFEQFSIPAFDAGRGPELCEGSTMASAKTRLPKSPVVLVSKLNPATKRVWWPERLGVGTAVCSPEFVALTPRSHADATWLYGCVAFDRSFYEQVLAAVTGTTGSRQRVKPLDVLTATVPCVEASAREEWEALATAVLAQRVKLLRESRILTAIRDALLPKLVSSQIRVPVSNDPAERLGTAVEALA